MSRRILTVFALLLLQPCALPAAAQNPPPRPNTAAVKPSFDCTAAKSKVKLLICNNDDLAALDVAEDQLLHRARAKAVTPDAVNADQDVWLAQRDACSNAACLSRAYRQRIHDLHAWAN
jgi:uncharacterized protein